MTCLLAGALTLALSGPDFTLRWTHSVEKTEWVEAWRIEASGLRLTRASVKGSGAGMEPGTGAILRDGWWTWQPDTKVPELFLAASGATQSGWQLCDGAVCHDLGARPERALRIAPCDG